MQTLTSLAFFRTIFFCGIFSLTAASVWAQAGAPVVIKKGPSVTRTDSKPKPAAKPEGEAAQERTGTLEQTRKGLPNAAASPLRDLNLQKPVPPDYLENLGYAYTMAPRLNCQEIALQIADLDTALADLDYDVIAAGDAAEEDTQKSDTVLDVVGGIASSIIPLRPVVRTATGARAAKKYYDATLDNGQRRRAFLKGYGLAKGCKPPAAPLVTYAPNWDIKKGQQKIDFNQPNRRLKDSYVAPAGQ